MGDSETLSLGRIPSRVEEGTNSGIEMEEDSIRFSKRGPANEGMPEGDGDEKDEGGDAEVLNPRNAEIFCTKASIFSVEGAGGISVDTEEMGGVSESLVDDRPLGEGDSLSDMDDPPEPKNPAI